MNNRRVYEMDAAMTASILDPDKIKRCFVSRACDQHRPTASRNAEIIIDRYGYYSNPMTYKELSNKYGISRGRCEQIVVRSHSFLASYIYRENLKEKRA